MAEELLFLVPGTGPWSQATELTAHKTGEPWPRLSEGTGDTGGCWWEHCEAVGLLKVPTTGVLAAPP